MKIIGMLAFMAFIGALIGGFTNHLAIKMLFRPHQARYIGKWRVPFTPGLIPKRRDELATQLGKTVTNYLLTPETFKKKLFTPAMEERVHQFIQKKLKESVFESEKTINDWLTLGGVTNATEWIETKAESALRTQLLRAKEQLITGTVGDKLPEKWQQDIQARIPYATDYFVERGKDFFTSDEGYAMLRKLLDDFLQTKGTFGNMVNLFFGESESLVRKVQKEVLKFLQAPGTTSLVTSILQTEWEKVKERPVADLVEQMDWEDAFQSIIEYVQRQLAVSEKLDRTICSYWQGGEHWSNEQFVPKLVRFLFDQGEKQLEISLNKLKIDEMVKEQVDTFPVETLEDLVLGISRREFKMITVLGALLGGAIGIVQGIVVLLFNLS